MNKKEWKIKSIENCVWMQMFFIFHFIINQEDYTYHRLLTFLLFIIPLAFIITYFLRLKFDNNLTNSNE